MPIIITAASWIYNPKRVYYRENVVSRYRYWRYRRAFQISWCLISRPLDLDERARFVSKKSRLDLLACERVCTRITSEITNERGKSCCESKHAPLLFYQLRNSSSDVPYAKTSPPDILLIPCELYLSLLLFFFSPSLPSLLSFKFTTGKEALFFSGLYLWTLQPL